MTIKFTATSTIVNGSVQENDKREKQKLALALKKRLGLANE